jgi:hypothetical protein
MIHVLLCALLLGLPGTASAEELVVGSGGKFESITAALASARIGDRIVVKPGLYKETLVWPGVHGIALTSEKGPAETIIQGNGKNPVIRIEGDLKWDTLVQGFTLRGGGAGNVGRQFGAGVNIIDASPTIRNCIITQNNGRPYRGTGGVFLWNSRAVVENNIIADNRYQAATLQAGGICVWEGMPKVEKNVIRGNSGEQEAYYSRAAGIRLQNSKSLVRGNIIEQNIATSVGSGVYASQIDSSCVFGNSITANRNLGGSYGAIAVEANSTTLIGGSGPGEANAIHGNIHAFVHDQKAQEKIRNLHPEYMGSGAKSYAANWYGGTDQSTLDQQLQKIDQRPPVSSSAVTVQGAGLLP